MDLYSELSNIDDVKDIFLELLDNKKIKINIRDNYVNYGISTRVDINYYVPKSKEDLIGHVFNNEVYSK